MDAGTRKRFMQHVAKMSHARLPDLALQFHQFYNEHHRPVGAHDLVPGERNLPRRPSETSSSILALSATCRICSVTGRLDAMRKTVCDHSSPCSKRILLQTLRDARAAWKEAEKQRVTMKRRDHRRRLGVKSPSLLAFCSSSGPRVGEASHPGP